ncbi:PGF-pre-PGF domain-containing protein [Halorubrum sp. Ea8]|uniref:PGF-pre-PGF domain-containing protein n=1 Tax=Halorubrum sp. Ea8 TaxID=1383841 RepID=UPI000B9800BE|nr:PGF-pre-PGF domain-containing protein [Halorubrum sp. Ea8]OYR48286.1 hypothetical protein DJ74_10970 [Halorubrum sp. Ea8]
MSSRRSIAITLAVCVLVSGIGFPVFGVGSAVAQDDGGDVPSLPATYYGELEVTGGTLSGPVLIEAVADGEVQDSIMTGENGQFGGPTISDEKLEVQPPDGDEVTFRVGGVTVNSISFESGTQEINLSASQEELAPLFSTTVTGSNSPIDAGETVTVDAIIENEGALSATQDINLVNADGDVLDSTSVSLAYNESTTVSLSWETETDTSVNETFTVESADTTASIDIEVERVTLPEIAPEPSPPATGGGGGGGGTDDGSETDSTGGNNTDDSTSEADTGASTPGLPADVESVHTEQQTIVSDEGFGLSQVRFSGESDVVSITWDSADVAGNVSVTALNDTPSETGPAPGALVSVSQITVPDNVTTETATLQFRADTTQIEELGAVTDDLQVYRFADGEWQQIDSIVVEESNDAIVLQAETPGFSYFAVSATGEPKAEINSPSEVAVGDTVSLNASNSTDQYGEVVSYEWLIDGESHNGESVTTEFEQAGDVEVELTVENGANKTNTTTTTISVIESSDASTGTSSQDSSAGDGSTDDSTPGFSSGLALIALLVSALMARQRAD